MNRFLAAAAFAAIGFGVAVLENSPFAKPVRDDLRRWLGANASAREATVVSAIICPMKDGAIQPLDAALVLRAIENFRPKGVAFTDPIEADGNTPILLSKLRDMTFPVVFAGSANLTELPGVRMKSVPSMPEATNVVEPRGHPVGAAVPAPVGRFPAIANQKGTAVAAVELLFHLTSGSHSIPRVTGSVPGIIRSGELILPVGPVGGFECNPLAGDFVETISLNELMLRTEESERGEISNALDVLFRDRMVVVGGGAANHAEGVAALANNLAETTAPGWMTGIGIVLLATLPWWSQKRVHRFLWAVVAAATWALLTLAVHQEFRIVGSIAVVVAAPLLALVTIRLPRPSDKADSREMSTPEPAAESPKSPVGNHRADEVNSTGGA